jgi:galactokinase
MLVAAIYDDIGNYGLSPVEWAIAGKYAENEYFGKPCGLMDQLACGLGGIVFIDFTKQESPRIETIAFDFAEFGYALAIVSTGSGHEDLTDEYASIPQEMKTVAQIYGQNTLQGISCEDLLKSIAKIRSQCSDRAFLRAWHFVHETERPKRMVDALQNRDLVAYLCLVKESGKSSWKYLQNVIGTQTSYQNL